MSRLYGAKINDENRWEVNELEEDYYHSYKLIDKDTSNTYYFNRIIGIEQITDDEFLVYKRASSDYYKIARYKLENSCKKEIYSHESNNHIFLNDDNILFYGSHFFFDDVYSISKNEEVEEAKWLYYKSFEIYENENNEKNLLIKDTLVSNHGDEYLMYGVDCNNFEPNSPCYSSLRNKFIDVKTKEDCIKIHDEDYKYKSSVDRILFETQQNNLKMAKEKILKQKKVD